MYISANVIPYGDQCHISWKAGYLTCGKFSIMNVIFYLIIISLVVAAGFLIAFLWAVRDGQYDDEYTPSVRILLDDDMIDKENKTN